MLGWEPGLGYQFFVTPERKGLSMPKSTKFFTGKQGAVWGDMHHFRGGDVAPVIRILPSSSGNALTMFPAVSKAIWENWTEFQQLLVCQMTAVYPELTKEHKQHGPLVETPSSDELKPVRKKVSKKSAKRRKRRSRSRKSVRKF
jgi:hypothetical protein